MKGAKIILGISGSIAAYKVATLCRLLVRRGAEVQVLMTDEATRFITPLTMSTLSKRPVFSAAHADESWNNHVDLGLWADALIVAPATANTLAKMANGFCDNIITAVYLSARCPVFAARAMDVDMWKHPATQRNIQKLTADGLRFFPVGHGELASGLTGEGRMAEPEFIIEQLSFFLHSSELLKGKNILITAGPTVENIDPVRFISNYSSGKMGIALARAALRAGAQVTLILGPVSESLPNHAHLRVIEVKTAVEMHKAALETFETIDIAILAAAVADFRPTHPVDEKMKKEEGIQPISLTKNPDIAYDLGNRKKKNQLVIGFALETENEKTNAFSKLHKKRLDLIVLNSLKVQGAGFQSDTNQITLLFANGIEKDIPLQSKEEVATEILEALYHQFIKQQLQ